MKNWEYKELVDSIQKSYKLGIDQNRSKLQSIGCISEDFFFYPTEDHLVENLICLIQTLKLSIIHLEYVFDTTIKIFKKQLSLVNDTILIKELSEEEKIHLELDVKYVLTQLNAIEIRPVNDITNTN